MKRAGFTMIELIFVIVILGILAAVAVPKLSATRDDAIITKEIANAKTCINDAAAHYTAHGDFSTVVFVSAACTAAAAGTVVSIPAVPSGSDTSLTISSSNTNVAAEHPELFQTHTFGGTSVYQ